MSKTNAIPLSYVTPEFPGLYWPFQTTRGEAKYLYTLNDIWRFTLYWTLITISLAHFLVALTAILTQFSSAYQRSQYLKTFRSSPRNPSRSANGLTDSFGSREDDQEAEDEKGPKRVKRLSTKNRKLLGTSPYKEALQVSGLIFGLYMFIGVIEATIAGSLVGLVLGAVYNSGFFRMSVWTPLCWGIINMLVLILASFRISGGL